MHTLTEQPLQLTINALTLLLTIGACWKIFEKAGQPGWACLVPIFQFYVLFRICGFSGWHLLFLFVPVANFVVWCMVCLRLSRAFGRSRVFALGLLLLPPLFLMILGFGAAEYEEESPVIVY